MGRAWAKSQTIQKPGRSEHSNAHADKIKKRRTVANSVTSVGESGDRDRCVGASVASPGVNTRPWLPCRCRKNASLSLV